MTIALIIIAYAIICLIEIPQMVKNNYRRELIIFSIFLLPALVLSLLQGAGVDLPMITPALSHIFEVLLPDALIK